MDDHIIPVTTNYLEAVYGPAPTFESLPQGDAVKRVLVEDFTAHQCGNCPAAAIIAEDLVANYEGQIAMAIHAGNLANTDEGYFDTDWTTEEGDVFGTIGSGQSRRSHQPHQRRWVVLGAGTVGGKSGGRDEPRSRPRASIRLRMGPGERTFEPAPARTFYDDVTGPVQVAWLTESHIFDYQLDYSADPEVVADYEFNHVLRGSVHGALGIGFGDAAGGAAPGMSPLNRLRSRNEWMIENATVLAVVSDANGYVLNVAEITWTDAIGRIVHARIHLRIVHGTGTKKIRYVFGPTAWGFSATQVHGDQISGFNKFGLCAGATDDIRRSERKASNGVSCTPRRAAVGFPIPKMAT